MYGNTQSIAAVIGEALEPSGDVKVMGVTDVQAKDLDKLDLLIVGAPTQGGRATVALQTFLDAIVDDALKGVDVAAFDTRFLEEKQNFALKLLMKTIGYAAPKMAATLQKKGGTLVLPPEGFIVEDKQGPLAAGETERARVWATACVNVVTKK